MPKLKLTKNGKPNATLVISAKLRQATQLAVVEFQHYVEKISGTRLPVATDEYPLKGNLILIGESTFTRQLGYRNENFFKDESVVKTGWTKDFNYLLIMGRDQNTYGPLTYDENGVYPGFNWLHDVGTLYGVIDFLEEECGIHWYLPGEIGEVVPIKSTIAVSKIKWRRRPWARHRYVVPRNYPQSHYRWRPEHLFHCALPPRVELPKDAGLHPVPDELSESFEAKGYPLSEFSKNALSYDYRKELWKIQIKDRVPYANYVISKSGTRVSVSCDAILKEDLTDDRNVNLWWLHMKMKREFWAAHNYGWFYRKFYAIPKWSGEEYGQKHPDYHPEYFAQGYGEVNDRLQPCFTNPKVIEEVVYAANKYFDTKMTYALGGRLKKDYEKGLVDGKDRDVSNELKKLFKYNARELSDKAKITKLDPLTWKINDEGKNTCYRIEVTHNKYLDIYEKIDNGPYFSISPLDGNNFCKCDDCVSKWEPPKGFSCKDSTYADFWNDNVSAYIWNFVNAVAKQVKSAHPTKWISCYAYAGYHKPPSHFQLEPNVAVMVCRPLMDSWMEGAEQVNNDAFKEWRKQTKKLYLYDYFLFPRQWHLDFFPSWSPQKIAKDLIKMKNKLGIHGAYNDMNLIKIVDAWSGGVWEPWCWPNPVLDQINFYVWMKYLDRQEKSVRTLLRQLFNEFYGPAARHIEDFVYHCANIFWRKELHEHYIEKYCSSEGLGHKVIYCPPEEMPILGNLMNRAYQAVEVIKRTNPIYYERVQLFDTAVYQMIETYSRD